MAAKHKTPPNTDDRRAIRALNAYRWLIAIAASVLFTTGIANELFHILWPALFGTACLAYVVLCLVSAWASYRTAFSLPRQLYLLIGTDIVFVLALVLATNGVSDGLAVLLLAPIAGASILAPPRMAGLFAAIASIALLCEEGFRYLYYPGDTANWAAAGILGALLFAVAIVASTLARQARNSAALAARHKSDLDDMTRLNERIIHQMSVGLLVIDGDHRIRQCNQAAHELLELQPDIIGRQLAYTLPALDTALRGWRLSPDASSKPFTAGEHRLVPRFDRLGSNTDAPILVFLDDARRISEQAQQIKLASLGRLTASIAHEIRNPLSAIGQAGQLLDESDTVSDNDRHILSIQRRHTRRIDEIVENVLSLSRRGKPLWGRIVPADWLPEFVTEYQQGCSRPAAIALGTIEPAMHIQADRKQLEQVLTNLCDNAERHADTGGNDLRVELSAAHTERGYPYLQVRDNGPGIDDALAGELMEPFFTTAHDGTGLGLYIARELCESNFANLTLATSEPGACFRIIFPRPDEATTPATDTANVNA